MSEVAALFAILATLSLGVVTPGPSFVLVARTAAARGRTSAMATAVGMGLGGAFFATIALAGLQAALVAVPTAFVLLKIGGGCYLIYLGYRIWRGAATPLEEANGANRPTSAAYLALGLSTQISNPKTAIVYASVFAAWLPGAFSGGFALALVLCAFAIETVWYGFVAYSLSSGRVRRVYLDAKAIIDRFVGFALAALGAKLAWSAFDRAS